VSLEGEPRHVSRDGETGDPVREIEAEIVPGALRVVAPPEDRASSDR
jgi:diacylglycerol kinase family enzyme